MTNLKLLPPTMEEMQRCAAVRHTAVDVTEASTSIVTQADSSHTGAERRQERGKRVSDERASKCACRRDPTTIRAANRPVTSALLAFVPSCGDFRSMRADVWPHKNHNERPADDMALATWQQMKCDQLAIQLCRLNAAGT